MGVVVLSFTAKTVRKLAGAREGLAGELASFRTVNYVSHDHSDIGRKRGGSSGLDLLQFLKGVVG